MFNLYSDGSYDKKTGKASYGFVIVDSLNQVIYEGKGFAKSNDLWNVSGEISGVLYGLVTAIELKLKVINVYVDYEGLIAWPSGKWKTKKSETIEYVEAIKELSKQIEINFVKVKGHSGNYFNEMVDKLAKSVILS